MRGTWQTDSHGNGPAVLVVLVIISLAIAAGSGAAAEAVKVAGELVHAVLIAVAVLAAVTVTSVAGFIVWRIRHRRPVLPRVVVQAASPPRRVPSSAQRQAVPAPQIHLHLHGPVTPAEVAAIISRPAAELHHALEDD